ncbi:MAG: hypothetical protein KAR31_01665, partial [Candidatus Omnitrophica bacterium]|nr:hypothetical protein [Candidatus Omnitrophota bacterium]
ADTLKRIEKIVGEILDVQPKNKVNASLSSRDLEEIRRANILSTCTTNSKAKRIAQWGMRLFPGACREVKEEASDMVGDYYSKDNEKLKSLLSHLNWNQYPDKYL